MLLTISFFQDFSANNTINTGFCKPLLQDGNDYTGWQIKQHHYIINKTYLKYHRGLAAWCGLLTHGPLQPLLALLFVIQDLLQF